MAGRRVTGRPPPWTVRPPVDLFSVYDDSTLDGGLRFRPMTPTRIVDSRIRLGVGHALGSRETVTVTAPPSVATAGTTALMTNLTAVTPSASTYLTVWPAGLGLTRPTVSNLNPAKGRTVANAVLALLGPDRQANVFNLIGTTDIVLDVVGAFQPGMTASGTAAAPRFRASTPRTRPLAARPVGSFVSPG